MNSIPSAADAHRPKVLLLADKRDWAYDFAAHAVKDALADEFECTVIYERDAPDLHAHSFDLLHVFFWGCEYHHSFNVPRAMVQKEISSHRWACPEYGEHSPESMVGAYLADAGALTATSRRLQSLFSDHRDVVLTPNGFDPAVFHDGCRQHGPVTIGWAGNRQDASKGVDDILVPAAEGVCPLAIAGGEHDRRGMAEFYRGIDVLAIASNAEGEPLTLVEALASGCFPVCVDVGIVPELVTHGDNGLVIERTPEAFREAFHWCLAHPDHVREAGRRNAAQMARTRQWQHVAPYWRVAFRQALEANRVLPPTGMSARETTQERNLGVNVGAWLGRATAAASCVAGLPTRPGNQVIDLGCGGQGLRRLLPPHLSYRPVDRLPRTPDTQVLDLELAQPVGRYRVALMLGLLEYLRRPLEYITWAAGHVEFAVFTYVHDQDAARRDRQHWVSSLTADELYGHVEATGGTVRQVSSLGPGQRMYVAQFS